MSVFLARVSVISSPKIIAFSVITVGTIFLLFVWDLWQNLPQDQGFYPDGFFQCPLESYNVTDDRGKVSCLSCPNCPHGQEPLPPCGSSVLASDARVECRGCQPGLYSDEFGIGACKPCGDCGLKTVISSCSDKKDIQCGNCREGYYEDNVTGTCKDCSSICCEKKQKPADYPTCLANQQCETNCTLQMQTVEKLHENLQLMFGKRHADKSTSSPTTLASSNWKHTTKKFNPTAATVSSMVAFTKVSGMDVKKRDISKIQDSNVGLPVETDEFLDMNIVEELVDTTSVHKPATLIDHANRHISPKFQHQFQPSMAMPSPLSLAKENEMTRQTQPHTAVPEHAPATVQTTGRSQSLFSTATVTQTLLGALLALILYRVMKCLFRPMYKRVHAYLTTCSLRKDGKKQEEAKLLGESQDNDDTEMSAIRIAEAIPEDLNLSELPPEVEDSLVILLDVNDQQVTERDVPHVVGHRLYKYGWQKVGQEFQISNEKLRYLELQYKQDNGSPTKKLFEILGSQGKTVAELISVLQRPTVNPPNVITAL